MLEAALTRRDLQQASKRIKANKGAAGVDGLDIEQTVRMLRTTGPDISQALRQGRYRPSPVRKVMLPKPDGSQRELGISTMTDRLIQQAPLRAQGAGGSEDVARQVAGNCYRWWRNSDGVIKRVLTVAYYHQLGVPRLS